VGNRKDGENMDKSATELIKSGLGDFSLQKLRWLNDGNDFLVELQSPNKLEKISLHFVWVTTLTIDISFSRYLGEPMLFQSSLEEISPTELKVSFDFGGAPDGYIGFNCSDVRFFET
jgi:hypothetical protein